MKKFRIVTTYFLLSICHLTLYGQTITDINVHFGMAGNTRHRFQRVDGGGSGEDRLSYLAGVQVGFGLTEKLTLVSGIDYARHNLTVVSAPMPEQRSTDGHITTLSFPLGIKWNMGRWFFIQGGPSLDVQPTKWEAVDNQNGIGLYAAIGGRYALGKWSLSLTPSVKQYALISFGDRRYPQRLLTAGALLAVGYEF